MRSGNAHPVDLEDESDFDNLYLVAVRRCGGSGVLHLEYGAPT